MKIKQHAIEQLMCQRRNQKNNENGNTTYHNLWDAARVVLRGKSLAINAYHQETKVSNKRPHFTPQGTRKRTKPKISRQGKRSAWK